MPGAELRSLLQILKQVLSYIRRAKFVLLYISTIMTRIITGLESLSGNKRPQYKQWQYWSIETTGVINGVNLIYVGPVLKDGTVIRLVKVFAGNRAVATAVNVIVNQFITLDPNQPIAQVNELEPIIRTRNDEFPSAININGEQFLCDWPTQKIITGANKRPGVAIRGFGVGPDIVRVSILYEEP